MPSSRHELLKGVAFFRALTAAQLDDIASASLVHEFPAQVVLQPQNEVPVSLFVLLRGAVEMYAREEDDIATVGVIGEGSVFTLAAVIANMPTATEARTTRRSQIAAVPAEMVRHLADTNHEFCKDVMHYVVRFSRALLLKLHTQKMRNTTERLALWMLENSTSEGAVEIPFEKRTLASILGTTPENLSRSFSILEPVVRKQKFKKYLITDPEQLAKIARPSPLLRTH